VAARKIIDYFILNQLGADSHLWAFNEGWGQRIAYHLTGYGGWLGLGRHWILALVLWGCALAAGLKFARTDKSARILLGLSGMAAWAYFFLVINPHMNPFFGLTFQILLLFSGAAFLGWLVGQGNVLWKRFVAGGFVLAVLGMAFLLAFRLPIRKIEFTFGLPVWISQWSRSPGYWACMSFCRTRRLLVRFWSISTDTRNIGRSGAFRIPKGRLMLFLAANRGWATKARRNKRIWAILFSGRIIQSKNFFGTTTKHRGRCAVDCRKAA
jgi:hypothetical protein